VVKFGGGVNGSLSVTETTGQEFSTTLAWNINTEVKVKPWNRARATLMVYEQPSIIDFTVRTKLSLPKRTLPVSVRRKGRDRILKTYYITNLNAIFRDYNNKHENENDKIVKMVEVPREGSRICDVIAEITSRGVCRNVSWKNQHVQVKCTKIEDAPAEFAGDLQQEEDEDGGE